MKIIKLSKHNQQRLARSTTKALAAVLSTVLLLSGCANLLPVAVEENDRVLSDQFDGTWAFQLYDINDNCEYNFVNRTYLTVKNGVGTTMGASAYISSAGDFRMQGRLFNNSGKVTRTYSGNLIEEKGLVVVGYPSLKLPDCSREYSIKNVQLLLPEPKIPAANEEQF